MRYPNLLAKIDQINRQDPNKELCGQQAVAKAYLYSQRMTQWLHRIDPSAPETLKIAAYAQHIKRWSIPRKDFPAGRAGYLRWRRTLAAHHARLTAELMQQSGYSTDEIEEVSRLLRKEGLKTNPQTQTLEDVACLVFLEYYLPEMMQRYPPDKLTAIIRKTWKKMSANGRKLALKIDYTVSQRKLVEMSLAD